MTVFHSRDTGLPSAVTAYIPKELSMIAPTRERDVVMDWEQQPRHLQRREQYLSVERYNNGVVGVKIPLKFFLLSLDFNHTFIF